MSHNTLNPRCAVGAEHHRPFRVVILDNQMPILSGIEAAKKVREMQETGAISKETKLALFSGDEIVNHRYYEEIERYAEG
jgi:CheY-like chemotaxis protein